MHGTTIPRPRLKGGVGCGQSWGGPRSLLPLKLPSGLASVDAAAAADEAAAGANYFA